MQKDQFFALPIQDQARSVLATLRRDCKHIGNSVLFAVPSRYHALMKMYHPDKFATDPVLFPTCEDIAGLLNEMRDLANSGKVAETFAEGDLSDVYIVDGCIKKVARDDDDLILNERAILDRMLRSLSFNESGRFYIPELKATGVENGMEYNVIGYSDDVPAEQLFSLAQLAEAYDYAPPLKALGWIWRRVLAAVGFASYFGVVHGAVTPDHILLRPGEDGAKQHKGYLIDWTSAVADDSRVRVIIPKWNALYPSEVVTSQTNVSPATDVYMASKSVRWAYKNYRDFPADMTRYFNRCEVENMRARGYKHEELMMQWEQVMYEKLMWNREFVPLNFAMVDWSWWD